MPEGSQTTRKRRPYKGAGHVPFLRKRRGRYLVQVGVPKSLQWRFGKTAETYLNTSDRTTARQKAPAAVAAIFDKFKPANQGGAIRSDELRAIR